MDYSIAFAFAQMISGIDKLPDTSWVKIVRSRAAIATQTVIDVYDNGYQETPTSPVRRLKPLFEVTPTFSYKEALDATEKLVISVIFHESSFRVDVERTIDGSSDCSYMQTKPGWISKVVPGKNCNDLKKDPKLAVFVGAEVLRLHKEYCLNKLPAEQKNTITAKYWLGAYASGTCGFAQAKARELCGPAGVCELK